jgi:hypothetical protein
VQWFSEPTMMSHTLLETIWPVVHCLRRDRNFLHFSLGIQTVFQIPNKAHVRESVSKRDVLLN